MRGVATGAGEDPGAPHQALHPLLQARIAGQPDQVLDPLGLQEVQERIAGKAPVQAHTQARPRKGCPQLGEQAAQQADRPAGGRPGARPQHGGHQVLDPLGVERQGGDERQVAPGVVVPVEERQLLLPVGGVVGGIEVDRDPPHGPAREAPLVAADHRVGQGLAQGVQRAAPHAILEPRQRGLRAERRAREWIAVHQQLVDRIVDQPGRVVAVGVATGHAEHALAQQLQELMPHLARLPRIGEGVGQSFRQAERGIDRLEQDGAPIRTGVGHVEARDDGLGILLEPEGRLRYTVCSHRASSRWCVETLRHRFYSTFARLDGPSLSFFANNPG